MHTLELVTINLDLANEMTGALLGVNSLDVAFVLDLDEMIVYQGYEHKITYTNETIVLPNSKVAGIIAETYELRD